MKIIKKINSMVPYKRIYLIIPALISLVFYQLAYRFPWAVEKYYTNGLYAFTSRVLGGFFSIFPFSVAEIIIVAATIISLFLVVRTTIRLVKLKDGRKKYILKILSTILSIVSIVLMSFVFILGLNYARPHYSELVGLEIAPSSLDELEKLCLSLVKDANSQRELVAENSSGVMALSNQDYYSLSKRAADIFRDFGESNPHFSGYVVPAKPVKLSFLMSHMNITGVIFLYTLEPNINVHAPQYTIPATALHEISHFKGIMQESEANFVAYLIGSTSSDTEFRYSATMMALVNSLNAYSRWVSPEEYQELREKLSPKVQNDLAYNNQYWQRFNTPIATFSQKVNDTYLKTNKQQDGVNSYGKIVDYLLAYQRQQSGTLQP